MKKLIVLGIMLLGLNSYSQKIQVETGIMTDNKHTLSVLFNNNKILFGVGFNGNASYAQGGVFIKNKLQIISGLGIEDKTRFNKPNELYNFYKINLMLNKNILVGFGVDNQNRGLYNIGYKF